ncbi:MAG: phosphatidate cytidylyltransferase [Candidatus Sericytochromatia bacterium]
MLKRVISGLIASALIILAEWFSPFIWFLAVCSIAIIGNYELQKMIEEKKYRHSYKLITTFIIIFLSVTYISAHLPVTQENLIDDIKLVLFPHNEIISPIEWKHTIANGIISIQNLILGVAFLLLFIVKLDYKPRVSIGDLSFAFMRMIYLGFFPSYIILLRALPNGAELLIGVLVSGAFSDMGAFFAGKSLGKTPFVQELSPNKTLEGAIGGAIACTAMFMTLNYFLIHLAWYHSLIIGVIVSIIAPMGDLIESLFKRDVGVKDSGNLIPGHGGMLDRVDSYIFTSFPVYYYVLFWVY